MSTLRRQLRLLNDNASFRLLFLATFGSGIGTWIAVAALTLDVWNRTSSGSWVAALQIVTFLPSVVVGLLFGPLIDRLSRRGLMIASDVARLGVFVALPFVDSEIAIVALAAVAGLGNAFFRPAVLAGLPNLVADDVLPLANSFLQGTEWAAVALGPVTGGTIVASSGPHLAYWINAATFLVPAALLVRIPARLLQSEQGVMKGHWRDLGDGVRVVARSRALVTALLAFGLVMIANGGVNVSEVVLAKVPFHSGDFGFGLLWTATGVGLVAGSVVASVWLDRKDLTRVYPAGFLVFAAGVVLAGVSPNVWLGSLAMVVSGFGNGVVFILTVLLVQKGAADHVRGRAFTLIISVHNALLGFAMAGTGELIDVGVSARWIYVGGGALIIVSAVIAVAMTRDLVLEPTPAAASA